MINGSPVGFKSLNPLGVVAIKVRNLFPAVLALNRQDGCPLGALVYQLPQSAKGARDVVGDGFETWRRRVEDGLVKMRERGELSQDANPANIALAVLAAVQGRLLLSKGEKFNRPLEVGFEMVLAYVAAHFPRAAGERRPIQTG